jgi:ubiquinone/menaquinone biosynthesis C-methylase UbiE
MTTSEFDAARSSISEVYSEISARYYFRWANNQLVSDYRQEFCEMLNSHGSIVDIGYGVGRDSKFFHDSGFDVVGVDSSVGMIA